MAITRSFHGSRFYEQFEFISENYNIKYALFGLNVLFCCLLHRKCVIYNCFLFIDNRKNKKPFVLFLIFLLFIFAIRKSLIGFVIYAIHSST